MPLLSFARLDRLRPGPSARGRELSDRGGRARLPDRPQRRRQVDTAPDRGRRGRRRTPARCGDSRGSGSRGSRRSCPSTRARPCTTRSRGGSPSRATARGLPPRVARGRERSIAARDAWRSCSTRSRRAVAGASGSASIRSWRGSSSTERPPRRAVGRLETPRRAGARARARARPAAARRAHQPPRHRGDPVARGAAARSCAAASCS